MTLDSHPRIYDSIGQGYQQCRVPDTRIARAIHTALGSSTTVCNVGAGTGAYEPADRHVIAVEPSQCMIAQRQVAGTIVSAIAERLPFTDAAFDTSMAILTIHHWTDPIAGLSEMRRIARRQVILTFDPDQLHTLWFVRDYLPELIEYEHRRAIPIDVLCDTLKTDSVETVPVPWDCSDGFLGAYWRRPHRYLQFSVRAAISPFTQLPSEFVSRAIGRLTADLQSGHWQATYGDLLRQQSIDLGYRLIVAET